MVRNKNSNSNRNTSTVTQTSNVELPTTQSTSNPVNKRQATQQVLHENAPTHVNVNTTPGNSIATGALKATAAAGAYYQLRHDAERVLGGVNEGLGTVGHGFSELGHAANQEFGKFKHEVSELSHKAAESLPGRSLMFVLVVGAAGFVLFEIYRKF